MKIIDNCTSDFLATEIETIFLDQYTNWLYDATTLGHTSSYDNEYKFQDTFQLIHPILDNGRPDSLYTQLVLNLGNSIFSNMGLDVLNYRRIKVNQLCKAVNNNSHPPHVDDLSENMVSLIYYVNDADGPTYFFNHEMQCVTKVMPKKNRGVIFPSNVYHASSSPIISNRRLVINYVAATSSKNQVIT